MGADDGVRLIIQPTVVHADDRTSGPAKTVLQVATASNVGSWVYWALIRRGSTLAVYRNAVAVGSVTLDNPTVASALDGAIGATGGTDHVDGSVDEVAVYNRALSPAGLNTRYRLAGYSLGRCAGQTATIARGVGPDRLTGTRGQDVIVSSSGNDRVSAIFAHDVVCGGPGNDLVYAGRGNDLVNGGPGNDRLFGGARNDRLFGGSGNDRITPGPGQDATTSSPAPAMTASSPVTASAT